MSDQELVDAFRRGDVRAFEAIVERYESTLLRYVGRYDRGGAQDLVQEVFLRLLDHAKRDSGITHLSAWLYRTARNLAIDQSRKEERMLKRQEIAAAPELQRATSPAVSAG
ncbi:MAG: sigma-70 family RNA polymerase sigma factor, partial [Planctomycetota bacterium]